MPRSCYECILRLEPGNKQAKAELEEVRIFINGSYHKQYNWGEPHINHSYEKIAVPYCTCVYMYVCM